jgi:hypothetical protein
MIKKIIGLIFKVTISTVLIFNFNFNAVKNIDVKNNVNVNIVLNTN